MEIEMRLNMFIEPLRKIRQLEKNNSDTFKYQRVIYKKDLEVVRFRHFLSIIGYKWAFYITRHKQSVVI